MATITIRKELQDFLEKEGVLQAEQLSKINVEFRALFDNVLFLGILDNKKKYDRHEAEEAARIANDYLGVGKYKLNFRWFGRSDIEQLNKEKGSKTATAEMFEKMLQSVV